MFPSGKGNQDLDNGNCNVDMEDDITGVENGKTKDGVEALENLVTSESADEVSVFPLEHCMRILPHDQNIGAFFIVVLQKVSPLPAITEKPSKQIDEQNVEPPNQSLENAQAPQINSSDNTIEEVVKAVPEENMIDNVSNTEDLEVSPLTREEQNSEETEVPHNAQDMEKKAPGKRKLQLQGQWRGVDPVVFFKDAIRDGVHIISLSLGPQSPQGDYFNDAISVASFHAARHGVLVVASTGNEGTPGFATNLAPWIITIAASSTDMDLTSDIILGNGANIKVNTNTVFKHKF
ncbi:unnamed protein product [Lathyrus sativus]|nr:unnamed protein product [Lathyrus sativus]